MVPTSPMLPPTLPRRDAEARARLHAVAARARPSVAAGDRRLPVGGRLGELLPAGLQRGSTLTVAGLPGTGATTVALTLAAAATGAGEWAAVVDPGGTLGARAAADAGVELERLAVVRRVTPDRWVAVVAALLDGVTVVVAAVPPHLRLGDARRLVGARSGTTSGAGRVRRVAGRGGGARAHGSLHLGRSGRGRGVARRARAARRDRRQGPAAAGDASLPRAG